MAGRRQSRGGTAQPKKTWLLIGIAAVVVILAVALVVRLSGKDKTEGEKEETPTKQEEASDTPQNTGVHLNMMSANMNNVDNSAESNHPIDENASN